MKILPHHFEVSISPRTKTVSSQIFLLGSYQESERGEEGEETLLNYSNDKRVNMHLRGLKG